MTVQYVIREVGRPSQTFKTAVGAAEALLAADRTERVTVLVGHQERELHQKELRRLGEALGEARARRAQEAENAAIAERLGLASTQEEAA